MDRVLTMAPVTPVSSHKSYGRSYTHKPLNSSPLAPSNSSPNSSPIAAVQARRLSQYKSRTPSGPVASSSRPNTASSRQVAYGASVQLGDLGDDSQTAFLRTRLKLRCIERAAKARERAVHKKRNMFSSSDDMDMDEDDDDDDEFDELYTRVIRNSDRKMQHAYLYSYDREVGSDFPDEAQNWESELAGDDSIPDDDAELLAYLKEQEEEAAFADFADIPADELFSWSDIDEDLLSSADAAQSGHDEMDLS
ncbi:hypothetical protein MSAN_00383600 [Mycena sanguinolenta]|uniref:Uncharacterized protein n=1 Tax=Mycena sanguinolenta TaxID=230812 RepID=A0A8H6ZG24_9AGAR|nr:hypothetical protein MSAN_00383600 [Mycena sanguinolenta]